MSLWSWALRGFGPGVLALSGCGGAVASKPQSTVTPAESEPAVVNVVPPSAAEPGPARFDCQPPADEFSVILESSAAISVVDAHGNEQHMLEQAGPRVEYRVEILERSAGAMALVRIRPERYSPGTQTPSLNPDEAKAKGWEQAFRASWVKLGEPFTLRLSGAPCLLDGSSCHAASVAQADFVGSLQATLEALNSRAHFEIDGRELDAPIPLRLPTALSLRLLGSDHEAQAVPSAATPNVQFRAERKHTVVTQKQVASKDGSPEHQQPQNNYWTTTARLLMDARCRILELETTTDVWTPLLERERPELPSGVRARRTIVWKVR